jgi:hypothetical protein
MLNPIVTGAFNRGAPLRTLYLPIYEPGAYHERSVANKQGLRLAFEAAGECLELDYLAIPVERLFDTLQQTIREFQPTLIFTQIQGPDRLTGPQLRELRQLAGCPIVNWNGDYWPHSLTSPEMLPILGEVDLQLVVNGSVLDAYSRVDIRAGLWPFGFERPNRELPDVLAHDVVYLGNNYSEFRAELYQTLMALPCNVGVYGNGWPQNDGECTYDFTTGEALYRRARIAISDNQFPDAVGYLSNRPFQALAAGCFVLQQHVERLEEFTGLIAGRHYIGFRTLDELPDLVAGWLKPENAPWRQHIARTGQEFVLANHSFEKRVQELLWLLEVDRA